MRRRRKKNPSGKTVLIVGGAVIAAVVAGVLLFEKNASASPAILKGSQGTDFATNAMYTSGMTPEAFAQIRAGDCITVVQGQAGVRISGDVPEGENFLMRVLSTNGSKLQAQSVDPRVPGSPVLSLGPLNLDGAGDC